MGTGRDVWGGGVFANHHHPKFLVHFYTFIKCYFDQAENFENRIHENMLLKNSTTVNLKSP